MRPTDRVLAAAAVLTTAVGLLGCGGDEPEERVLRGGTLTIAYPSAGSRADLEVERGARIALAEINALGGVDGVLRLRIGRDAGRGRVLLVPCVGRVRLGELMTVAERRRALAIGTCGAKPDSPSFWPLHGGDAAQAGALASYAEDRGYGRVWIARLAPAFAASFERSGLEVTRNLDGDVGAAFASHPALVRDLRAEGVDLPILGSRFLDSRRALLQAGGAMEGVTFATFGYPEPGSELDEFNERYRGRYGREPDGSAAALGYQAVKVLEAAINEVESTRPADLRAAMRGLEVGGPLGPVEYPASGGHTPTHPVALVTVRDGRFELVSKTMAEDAS